MTNYERYQLLVNAGDILEAIKKIIADNTESGALLTKYNRYIAEDLEIQSRTFSNTDKVNHKINNDFFGEIIDTKVGYMVGNPITYNLIHDSKKETSAAKAMEEFFVRNSIDDVDSDTVQMAAVCGIAYRLLYIDIEGFERIKNINPWEIIYITLDDVPVYTIRYYKLSDDITHIDFYTTEEIHFIQSDGDNYSYREEGIVPHRFPGVPIVKFRNNAEELGDCDKVIELINAYDRTFSDVHSELEQLRLAYLALLNADFDDASIEAAKRTGAIALPEGADAKFITKDMDGLLVDNTLARTDRNILRFAKSANFTDHEFSTSSGIALRYKLLPLMNKAIKTQRKFSVSLREQFRLLAGPWQAKGFQFDYLDVWWQFKPNIPVDIQDEASATNKLKGFVSERTRLSLLTFVDDVDHEIREMEEDLMHFSILDTFSTTDTVPVEETVVEETPPIDGE